MIDESTVNSQITDSVTQADTLLMGNSASQSMSLINLVTAETLGMSMHNAVNTQQNSQMSAAASVTASCAKILSTSPPVTVKEPEKPDVPPPFMPLDASSNSSDSDENKAADFVKQATQMAEKAITMMEADDKSSESDKKGLQSLIEKLKNFAPGNNNDASGSDADQSNDSGSNNSNG